ncbi:MAG: hypothetical protein AB1411_04065 [Nitrospirota bacterium]
MSRDQQLKQLKRLQAEVDAIRRDMGISAPDAVLYLSPLYALEDEVVVVEADGFGGATTCVVEGNYPVDYITKFEKHFVSEEKALRMAEDLVEQIVSPNMA